MNLALTILGGLFLGLVAGLAVAMALLALANFLHEWRLDRLRERQYAERWVAEHKRRQDDDRYLTDIPGRPE